MNPPELPDPPVRPDLDPDGDFADIPLLELHRQTLALEEAGAVETGELWRYRSALAGRRLLAWANGDRDGAALRLAVVGNPDDDTARLVMCDWLNEQGRDREAALCREYLRQTHHPNTPITAYDDGVWTGHWRTRGVKVRGLLGVGWFRGYRDALEWAPAACILYPIYRIHDESLRDPFELYAGHRRPARAMGTADDETYYYWARPAADPSRLFNTAAVARRLFDLLPPGAWNPVDARAYTTEARAQVALETAYLRFGRRAACLKNWDSPMTEDPT